MKHLKKYEILKNIKLTPKYEVGNILKVTFSAWNTTKTGEKIEWISLYIVKKIHNKINSVVYSGHIYDGDTTDTIYVLEQDVIEKISKEEADMLININKYNL